ncbi:unnamed protein product, partial [Linum tenue]
PSKKAHSNIASPTANKRPKTLLIIYIDVEQSLRQNPRRPHLTEFFSATEAEEVAGNGQRYRKLWEAKEQDPHPLRPMWPPELSPPEESLLRLRLPRQPPQKI